MATDVNKVRVGITGAVSKAPYATPAPTDATTALTVAYVDSGAISEDGVTLSLPGSGDRTTLNMWQNGAVVRTLRTLGDDLATISFTFLETNKISVETYFDVTVTQTASHGTFDYSPKLPNPFVYTLDVLDGTNSHRYHIPRGIRAEVGELVYKNDEPLGYEVTIELEKDPTAGYALRGWMTDLKTGS